MAAAPYPWLTAGKWPLINPIDRGRGLPWLMLPQLSGRSDIGREADYWV